NSRRGPRSVATISSSGPTIGMTRRSSMKLRRSSHASSSSVVIRKLAAEPLAMDTRLLREPQSATAQGCAWEASQNRNPSVVMICLESDGLVAIQGGGNVEAGRGVARGGNDKRLPLGRSSVSLRNSVPRHAVGAIPVVIVGDLAHSELRPPGLAAEIVEVAVVEVGPGQLRTLPFRERN